MTNKNNTTLYIGVTNDLIRRVYEHKNKLIRGFTSRYNLTKLVYYEIWQGEIEAIQREKQLKNWHKEWKLKLITEQNPNFDDLYNGLL